MSLIPEIARRGIAFYRMHGFWELLKAALAYSLEKWRRLPLIRPVIRRYRSHKVMKSAMKRQPLKLHLGCGSVHLNGYINIDKFDITADLVTDAARLPFPNNSVDEIFTSHMVEHLTYSEFMEALREWKRVLKESAILITRCPNFEKHLKDWLNADYKKRWGERNEGVNFILGFQGKGLGHINRNIFTSERLADLVSRVGFEIIECHPVMNRYGDIPDGDILLRASKREE